MAIISTGMIIYLLCDAVVCDDGCPDDDIVIIISMRYDVKDGDDGDCEDDDVIILMYVVMIFWSWCVVGNDNMGNNDNDDEDDNDDMILW